MTGIGVNCKVKSCQWHRSQFTVSYGKSGEKVKFGLINVRIRLKTSLLMADYSKFLLMRGETKGVKLSRSPYVYYQPNQPVSL